MQIRKDNKGLVVKKVEQKDEIIKMRLNGVPTKEIAVRFRTTDNAIRCLLRYYGVKLFEYRNTGGKVSETVREKTGGRFEYVSGYVTKESPIKIKCVSCGAVVELTYHHIVTCRRVADCPVCKARAQEIERSNSLVEHVLKEKGKEAKEKEDASKRIRIPHLCPVCGRITVKPKYCSIECRNKACYSSHEHSRRLKIQSAMVDKDITVKGLFLRDKGICAICGKPCDINDYEYRDGVFIAGNNYPSVDHIIPLSKGGVHSWDNVQLAHRICNTKKRDHIYGEGIRSTILQQYCMEEV